MIRRLKTKNSYFVELPLRIEKKRGNLCFGEAKRHIPFAIKRFYYVFDVPSKESRGGHAHKKTKQVLFCLRGSIRVELDDGVNKDIIFLSKPNIGIFLGKMLWHKMTNFKKDTILLILTSEFFNEKDYIRNYNIFKKLSKRK